MKVAVTRLLKTFTYAVVGGAQISGQGAATGMHTHTQHAVCTS